MKVSGFYLSNVSAEKAVKDLCWRISTLEASQAQYSADAWRRKYNDSSIRVYRQILRGWQLERLHIIRQRVAHSARLTEVHQSLADEHRRNYRAALERLHKAKRDAGVDGSTKTNTEDAA